MPVTDKRLTSTTLFTYALVLATALMSACTDQASEDICNSHHLFHASHVDRVSDLQITHTQDGTVRADISIPKSILDTSGMSTERLAEIIRNPDNVFSFQFEGSCGANRSNVTPNAAGLNATYQMECDSEVRIAQIDVLLFDVVDELDEVVANIATPATQKRFAINRQCDRAIFRLQSMGED